MFPKQPTTSTSALPPRPERPFVYVCPVATPDGSIGYDRPLENYFDPSMAQRLLPSQPSSKLYDTVARAHDHHYQLSQDMLDLSWSTLRPLILNQRERPRSLAKLAGDSPDHMGISPDVPGWHPRRIPLEDRRGVTPSEVNTLVPYIPPIDASSPPPSRERLDAMAKRFLADAHADFADARRHATNDVTDVAPSEPPPDSDDITFFDYDTDSTLDGAVTAPRASISRLPHQAQQLESTFHDADDSSNDTDTDTDTDTNTDSDDAYDWSSAPPPPSGPGSRWLIPRRRPSVVIVDNKEVASDVSRDTRSTSARDYPTPPPPSSDDERPAKRQRGGCGRPKRATKQPKRHENDTPTRQRRRSVHAQRASEDARDCPSQRPQSHPPPSPPASDMASSSCPPISSITATALQMNEVRITSPDIHSSPLLLPSTSVLSPPRSPKVFPCLLNGCTQICASAGDLQRHQQSLRHRAPSHTCLACGKSYTRSDALKRHLNSKASCKKHHMTKVANTTEEGEEGIAEANDEAVQVVAASSSS